MEIKSLPDWRLHFAAEIGTVSGANPLGTQPGDFVLPVADTKTPEEGRVYIPVVSPYRLALSIAIRASTEARSVRKLVRFSASPERATSARFRVSYHATTLRLL